MAARQDSHRTTGCARAPVAGCRATLPHRRTRWCRGTRAPRHPSSRRASRQDDRTCSPAPLPRTRPRRTGCRRAAPPRSYARQVGETSQRVGDGREAKLDEQPLETRQGAAQSAVVTHAGGPGHGDAGLLRVDLPRVDVERPGRAAACAVPQGRSHRVPKRQGRLVRDPSVIPAVRRNLVAGMRDLAYQIRMPLRHPANDEERGAGLVAREQLEQATHASDDPGFEAIPIGTRDARFKRRDLEVLFDVDGEVMADHARPGLQRPCPATQEQSNDTQAAPHHTTLRRRHGARSRGRPFADPRPTAAGTAYAIAGTHPCASPYCPTSTRIPTPSRPYSLTSHDAMFRPRSSWETSWATTRDRARR